MVEKTPLTSGKVKTRDESCCVVNDVEVYQVINVGCALRTKSAIYNFLFLSVIELRLTVFSIKIITDKNIYKTYCTSIPVKNAIPMGYMARYAYS